MTLRLGAFALLLTLLARPVAACPPPSESLLFHSCWGEARLALALLPEDLPLTAPGAGVLRLAVTGAYTATDSRAEGRPKPVGLFLRQGEVVNRNLGRMDGVLVVDPADGQPGFHHRRRVALPGRSYDLTELDQRRAFIAAAAERGLSVMQSHLLIAGGVFDVHPQEGAPAFVRRLLFADGDGFGVWQTRGAATLYEAARAVYEALAPRMVMNLDMGSYDFCRRVEAGRETSCGSLAPDQTGKLSNLVVLTLE